VFGEFRWLYHNKSNDISYVGEPNIMYTKNGLFVFMLDNQVLYRSNYSVNKYPNIKSQIDLILSDKGQIMIG